MNSLCLLRGHFKIEGEPVNNFLQASGCFQFLVVRRNKSLLKCACFWILSPV